MMDFFAAFTPEELVAAFGVALVAGTVKGLVGFAMPMILVSGLSMFMSPEIALAGLILPTLVTNGMQALRQGVAAAVQSMKRFRLFLLVGLVFLLASAQMVRVLPQQVMLLIIGVPVSLFALTQLMGKQLTLSRPTRRSEALVGGFAGLIGGMSGIWGPPTVAYLTALGTEKSEQIRVQGVIYGMGAVALLFGHIASGVMRAETAPFSVALILPAVLGMWVGGRLHDRIDQVAFRRVTLVVLLVAGLNLLRRALML
ncbi:sulfite exporter TauE/SafE family protein [Phaeobacter sp. QD34_3]|uniref:sulfite exporter TauE/SafE family protein n=2 Tax=unclassified Phaeobacter TaxID=2621772 RepID=UPI00237F4065|nr:MULTISPECIES: sulfite exporter TauE/SafE family protein [unclassified Phaeobacter]MDE4132910.1 sulfite exporter TauE/SafE family protein [Phaeobacter sp. QD34_3]MDE4136688.1 sulfite exporter TauE/SafE family protein [Phaeobacter sp. QD34_24]